MKEILVLGAGMVARPLVRYLLEQPDFQVRCASRTVSKAEKLIEGHPRGEAQSLNVKDAPAVEGLITQADLVVSLLPWVHHMKVARLCLDRGKPMVTTSYVSKEMEQLDEKAKEAGIIILNEIGLDPGIDHMSAVKIMHEVRAKAGTIKSFRSYCGALPAPEANTNPWGYKFSWSPRGVLLAAKNQARYLEDGEDVLVPGEELFEDCSTISIEGLGDFEVYANRDSMPYIEKYELSEIETMFRGTLRYPGWCETWKSIGGLGLLNEEERTDLEGLSFRAFLGKLIQSEEEGSLEKNLASYLGIDEDSDVMKRFRWLGLLSDEPLPVQSGSALDVLGALMLDKLKYEEGERDMVVLHHDFVAELSDGRQKITSTMIDFGIPGGDSAVARTVGLPAAIGVKLILEGTIKETGVRIPVDPQIYEPVLAELEQQGIASTEKSEVLH